jgi:thioredoxin-related protein
MLAFRPVRLRFVLLVALALALPARAQQAPEWFAETFLDVREDVADAARENKRLMLYFWLEGCPYCKTLEEVTFRDPAVVARMKREFVSVALNVRGDRETTWTDGRKRSEKDLTGFLGVRGTPTLIFFDEKGAVAQRVSGYVEPRRFLALLERASPAPSAGSPLPPGPRAPR